VRKNGHKTHQQAVQATSCPAAVQSRLWRLTLRRRWCSKPGKYGHPLPPGRFYRHGRWRATADHGKLVLRISASMLAGSAPRTPPSAHANLPTPT
jgi:hypothetical protein